MSNGGQGWPSGNNKDNKWSGPVDEKQQNMRKMTKQATENQNDSWKKPIEISKNKVEALSKAVD